MNICSRFRWNDGYAGVLGGGDAYRRRSFGRNARPRTPNAISATPLAPKAIAMVPVEAGVPI